MARDDFSKPVIDRLAKRVGMRCSYPDCRAPTSGPDMEGGVTNVGVAAHITAASPGGPRYDETLTSEGRSDISNGIWLCQIHAKLIDDDELAFPASTLKAWKETAEMMAALETRGFIVQRAIPFGGLERKAPTLIAEMQEDLTRQPLVREFVLLSKRHNYGGGSKPSFQYFYEDHEYLASTMTIMVNVRAIREITFNSVPRFEFTEPFVSYLIGES